MKSETLWVEAEDWYAGTLEKEYIFDAPFTSGGKMVTSFDSSTH